MATYAFSVSEALGIPEQITFTDDSVSPSPGLTSRKIFVRLANGNWLTTSGESSTAASETWPIGQTTITLALLTKSTATEITVDWMTNSTVTGTESQTVGFVLFDYLFAYNLIGAQTSSPSIIQDSNYYSNFSQFIVNLFCAETATTYEDIYSAQQAMNKNFFMQQNEQTFF